jgi:hypothetical protein
LVCLAGAVLFGWAAAANGPRATLPVGTWGGPHIRLVTTSSGASVEYDCAYGSVDEPLRPAPDGSFEVTGTHVREPGGPGHIGDREPPARPAHYRGRSDGQRMRLEVVLPESGQRLGPFELELGRRAELEKCH